MNTEHRQLTSTIEPLTERTQPSRWNSPMFIVALFVVPIMAAIVIIGRDVIVQDATPIMLYAVPGVVVIVIVAVSLAIRYFMDTLHHQQQVRELEREKIRAEIEATRFQTRLLNPTADGTGNFAYSAYVDSYGRVIQPEPTTAIQPVPHTYSPHNAFSYDSDYTTPENSTVVIPETNVQQPNMDFILSQLRQNNLEVCLGVSTTTGKPFVMNLIDGTHYRIIGGSGFGKSCFAASLLEMTTATNDPERIMIALLDLEHKTSKLFEHLPHVAQLQVGRRTVDCVATSPDEVAEHFGYLRKELDRRKALNEYDLQREQFMLIYVEEFLSLKREVDPELLQQMTDNFTILALRGRKYRMYLLACAQVDYADKMLRDAMNQFNVNASFSVKPKAAQAVGFTSYDLLKQNFAAKQRGQFVLETTGCNDIMLAPHFDVKTRLLQLERSQSVLNRSSSVHSPFQSTNVRLLNASRTDVNADKNYAERVHEVQQLRLKAWGKQAIIECLWNVKKGGSTRYQEAEAEYEAILTNIQIESEA